jgi:hypothetical protein
LTLTAMRRVLATLRHNPRSRMTSRLRIQQPSRFQLMKKFACLLLALAVPFALFAQEPKKDAATAPKKNLLSMYRVEVKTGHEAAFKAAIAAHAQKYHKGDHTWRVGEVLTGPEGGMYQLNEGPTSWTTYDGRGDLGAEHTKDYETNVQPHVEKTTPDTLMTFQPDLSTVALEQYSNKVLIRRLTVKPGRGTDAVDVMKRLKAVYEKKGISVAVWHTAWSGENMYSVVVRLKNGLKDLDSDLLSTRKTIDEMYGANEYARIQQASSDNYSKIVDEIIEFKPELGSK